MAAKKPKVERPSIETLHKLGCKACPLAGIAANRHPDMPASGAKAPLVYMLGEAPGKEEDFKGRQFIGQSGRLLRSYVPEDWEPHLRWNNVVRTRPLDNATPEFTEIECCRPSVERDIETSKPDAIFGFGNIPLAWVCGQSSIGAWRGRRMPVKIGSHSCWYYAHAHPAYILRLQHNERTGPGEVLSFKLALQRAFDDVAEGLPDPIVHTAEFARSNVECVTGTFKGDARRVVEFLKWAGEQPETGFDIETSALRPYSAGALILSMALGTPSRSMSWAWEHPEARWSSQDMERITQAFLEFLRSPAKKAVHFLGFETEWITYTFGIEYARGCNWHSTESQAYVLDERKGGGKPGAFALDFLARQHFGIDIKALSPKFNKAKLIEVPLKDLLPYNGIDAKYHCLLYRAQRVLIKGDLQGVYTLQRRRIPTFVLTQLKGLPVDAKLNEKLGKEYQKRLDKCLAQMRDLKVIKAFEAQLERGKGFNPNSNPQMVTIFRDMLRVNAGFRKERGVERYSVDDDTLLQVDHPLAKLLQEWRSVSKLKGTYVDPLKTTDKDTVVFPDGLLHPILNSIFTVTGRTSSESPNEQNFPKRDEGAREVRGQIVAPDGELLVAFDYAQLEARIIAMASRDPALIKYLWEGHDIHMEWTEKIAHEFPACVGGKKYLTDKKAMKKFRTDIKSQWTFPLFYGAKLETAAHYLNVPLDRKLTKLYEEFWTRHEGVLNWQKALLKEYERTGYVETLTHRRRHAPMTREEAVNSPIQGTASDIVVEAMNRLSEQNDWTLQAVLNVHDDLSFFAPVKKLDDYVETIVGEMLRPTFDFINVPLGVEVCIGENWCDIEEVAVFRSDKWWNYTQDKPVFFADQGMF